MDISAKHMLRKARDAANLSRLVASEALFVSTDVIKRWEDPTCTVMSPLTQGRELK